MILISVEQMINVRTKRMMFNVLVNPTPNLMLGYRLYSKKLLSIEYPGKNFETNLFRAFVLNNGRFYMFPSWVSTHDEVLTYLKYGVNKTDIGVKILLEFDLDTKLYFNVTNYVDEHDDVVPYLENIGFKLGPS